MTISWSKLLKMLPLTCQVPTSHQLLMCRIPLSQMLHMTLAYTIYLDIVSTAFLINGELEEEVVYIYIYMLPFMP
jgi:hypothetical protein